MMEVKIILKGGLGNQMFQYAFGRAQSLKHNASLILDTSWYDSKRTYNYPYVLDKFNVVNNESTSVNWEKRSEKRVDYDTSLLRPSINDNVSYSGYFQDADYFRNYRSVLLKELTLKEDNHQDSILYFKKMMHGRPSVFVHVRRGERTNGVAKQTHGLVSKAFYTKGMQIMRNWHKDPQFVCFTDDRDWVSTNMKEEFDFIMDSHDFSDYDTMNLMCKCDHAIIPNSCFSWWGAWLIPNMKKTIIAASRWSVDSKYTNCNICPTEWVRMDPEFEK